VAASLILVLLAAATATPAPLGFCSMWRSVSAAEKRLSLLLGNERRRVQRHSHRSQED
jgi:hypothetical protein